MTTVYNSQKKKYIVKISLSQLHGTIKLPKIEIIGEYNTAEEAEIARAAAILVKMKFIENYTQALKKSSLEKIELIDLI